MEAGAEAEQGGTVRLTGEKQPLGRSDQLGAAQDMIVAPRAGEGNLGLVSNPVQQQEVNAHSLQGASFNARPVVDGAAGLGQLQGLTGMGTGQPKAPPVFAAGAQQQSRNQGQAGQRNASATARPPGSHFPASFMPANLPLGGHSDTPSQRGGSAAMQPSRSPFRGGPKQPGGPASGDAPVMWGAPKPAARQLSSPGRRSDALPGPHPVGQQTLRHPAPRFLGGGSQPGSAVLRQPLGYGAHLMAQDGSAGKAHQAPGARQGLPSQAGEGATQRQEDPGGEWANESAPAGADMCGPDAALGVVIPCTVVGEPTQRLVSLWAKTDQLIERTLVESFFGASGILLVLLDTWYLPPAKLILASHQGSFGQGVP